MDEVASEILGDQMGALLAGGEASISDPNPILVLNGMGCPCGVPGKGVQAVPDPDLYLEVLAEWGMADAV